LATLETEEKLLHFLIMSEAAAAGQDGSARLEGRLDAVKQVKV
jgi:hypothetical protein